MIILTFNSDYFSLWITIVYEMYYINKLALPSIHTIEKYFHTFIIIWENKIASLEITFNVSYLNGLQYDIIKNIFR